MAKKMPCVFTSTRDQRGATAGREAQVITCSSPCEPIPASISLLKAHLHKCSGAECPKGRGKSRLQAQRMQHSVQAPPRAVLANTQFCGPVVISMVGSPSVPFGLSRVTRYIMGIKLHLQLLLTGRGCSLFCVRMCEWEPELQYLQSDCGL